MNTRSRSLALLSVLVLALAGLCAADETAPKPGSEDAPPTDPLDPNGEPPSPEDPSLEAQSPSETKKEDEEYRTPLAGRPLKTSVFGTDVDIQERYRGNTLAVTLGLTFYTPNIGGQTSLPLFAGYWRRIWEQRRIRAIVSGVVNTFDYSEHLPGGLEGVLHFDNTTIPFASNEIIDGDSLDYTSLEWGWTRAHVGGGYRRRIWPFNIDNDFKIQLSYQASYYYFKASKTLTGKIDGVPVFPPNSPPDTYVHGLRLKVAADMIQRNILEMPHYGIAIGSDLALLRRDRWEDMGLILPNGKQQFEKSDTRDFLRLSGYLIAAVPIPFLSERHRVVAQVHAGWMPSEDADRFNGFRLGGGPQPTETNDLGRSPYPGATFDQFVSTRYLLGTLEYRYEIFFWMYLHLRATAGWARVPTFSKVPGAPLAPVRFITGNGQTFSGGLTSGFLWDSVLSVEYSYDTGALRGGERGHGFSVVWSKSF